MQFALRQRFGFLLMLWALLTLLCAVAGPFGTLNALSLPARTGYWAISVGLSILGSVLVTWLPARTPTQQVAVWSGYTVVLALCVHAMNWFLFEGHWSAENLFYLIGIIGLCVVVVHGVIHLAEHALGRGDDGEKAAMPDPTQRFLQRLPLEIRAPLVRIEAQDHYLNVVTTKGSDLILLRLSEAVAELDQAPGLQIHRSHWIATAQVRAHRRVDGQDRLIMSDGASLPVARTRRKAAQEAGLF